MEPKKLDELTVRTFLYFMENAEREKQDGYKAVARLMKWPEDVPLNRLAVASAPGGLVVFDTETHTVEDNKVVPKPDDGPALTEEV